LVISLPFTSLTNSCLMTAWIFQWITVPSGKAAPVEGVVVKLEKFANLVLLVIGLKDL